MNITPRHPLAPKGYKGQLCNWRGTTSLFQREVMRFLAISTESLVGPALSSVLFLALFTFALGENAIVPGGVSYMLFLIPGLVLMGIMESAFANGGFSLVHAKWEGNIADFLSAPLSPWELAAAFLAGNMARGFIVGVLVLALLSVLFDAPPLPHPFVALWFAALTALLFALIGSLTGVLSLHWEGMMVTMNFFITPLSILSGTFYTLDQLPDSWARLAVYNPVWYLVDGFRYGFLGVHESNLVAGSIIAVVTNAVLLFALVWLLRRRWRLWDASSQGLHGYLRVRILDLRARVFGTRRRRPAVFSAPQRLARAARGGPRVPAAFVAAVKEVVTLARRAVLRTLENPAAWLGDLVGTGVLAWMFIVIVPESDYAPAGWTTAAWLAPGLVAIATWHMAFAVTAYSFVLDRDEGGMEDILIPPISSFCLLCGWLLGALVLALSMGVACWGLLQFFLDSPVNPLVFFLWLGLGSIFFAALGILAGIPAQRFDEVGAWEIFLVYPFLMLSGFLGASETLPPIGQALVAWNPLTEPVSRLRIAWSGRELDVSPWGLLVILGITLLLVLFAWWRTSCSPRLRA